MSMKEAGASGLKLPDRKKILKKAFRGVRFAATSTTTALGNVASEMLGRFVRALARGRRSFSRGMQLGAPARLSASEGERRDSLTQAFAGGTTVFTVGAGPCRS
jgi:hypothetical protein